MNHQLTFDDLLMELGSEVITQVISPQIFTPIILKYEVVLTERLTLITKKQNTGQIKNVVCYRQSYYPLGRTKCREFYAMYKSDNYNNEWLHGMLQREVNECLTDPIVKYTLTPREGE